MSLFVLGELPQLEIEVLIHMSERSLLGIEKTILWLGRKAIKDNHQSIAESFKTIVGCTLLRVCSQSPFVFQVSSFTFRWEIGSATRSRE